MEFLPFLCLLLALSATFGIGGGFWSLLTPIFPIMTTLLMFKLFIDPAGSGCGNTTLLQDGRALSTQLALSLAIISFQLGLSVAIIPGSELQQYKSLTQATSIKVAVIPSTFALLAFSRYTITAIKSLVEVNQAI